MDTLQTFSLKELEAGKVDLPKGRSGGKFARIREIAAQHLKTKGEACRYYDLAKAVEADLNLDTPQKAYNYVRSALKADKRFEVKKFDGVNCVARVA